MPELVETQAGEEHAGMRLDVYLAEVVEDATRSFIKKLIKDGKVSINGRVCDKPSRVIAVDNLVSVEIPDPPPAIPEPEDIPQIGRAHV